MVPTRTVHTKASVPLRLLAGTTVVLAVVGGLAAAILLLTAPKATDIGEAASTPYGTFTVTRATTTFVPATQGPPTAEKMAGTEGTDQLQVWVRLDNAKDRSGVAYGPDQFRLRVEDGQPHQPQGSTLADGVLPRGASISGQLWFDTADLDRQARTWLEYDGPGGRVVAVEVSGAELAAGNGAGHGHG